MALFDRYDVETPKEYKKPVPEYCPTCSSALLPESQRKLDATGKVVDLYWQCGECGHAWPITKWETLKFVRGKWRVVKAPDKRMTSRRRVRR